jgi:hypothetical protein
MYDTAEMMRYIIYIVEMSFLIYSIWQINRTKTLNQINISKESKFIAIEWTVLSAINLILKLAEIKSKDA